ncbi:glycosyl-4,4'-diaponeurosporenoate acyltransferase CrtO family protein [Lacinutrix jangbogonensis]|uniref:glycosyl-4,4'-diaponeurosporenoate acyltransferase CrtO family protein n=1 Tax=Lacinutrix jangbogonensis TaxID=1469557 RepID=UPI00053E91B6|nr:hypothetical protein [Lacinutrix jangbogonensis]
MIKKIAFSLLALFLAYQTISIFVYAGTFPIKSSAVIVLVAAYLNLIVTGVFAFTGFVFPTQKLLPESYYSIKNSKSLKRTFKYLKVDFFRSFLLATVWRNKNKQKGYFNGNRDGFKSFVIQSKKSEFGHLIPFIILTLMSFCFLFDAKFILGLFTIIINVIFNFYPILLQRHHRMRIAILEKRYGKK